MEALLNFAWLAASLALLGFGLLHYRGRSNRRHATWLIVVALGVIAVVLFPVISCTDDLNPTIFASEDLSRRHVWSSVIHAPSHSTLPALVLIVALLFAIGLTLTARFRPLSDQRSGLAGFFHSHVGRAPPALA